MVTVMSAIMTKGGQTTAPKVIRRSLDIIDNAHVHGTIDGTREWVSAQPDMSLEITSVSDFYERLDEAEEAIAGDQLHDAAVFSSALRQKYSLE